MINGQFGLVIPHAGLTANLCAPLWLLFVSKSLSGISFESLICPLTKHLLISVLNKFSDRASTHSWVENLKDLLVSHLSPE